MATSNYAIICSPVGTIYSKLVIQSNKTKYGLMMHAEHWIVGRRWCYFGKGVACDAVTTSCVWPGGPHTAGAALAPPSPCVDTRPLPASVQSIAQ